MSKEETKDQPTETKPPESEEFKFPERGFFQGDDMLRFMDHIEQLEAKKEPPKTQKTEEPCPEGSPCAEEKKKAKPPEGERKPYKILKVEGKEIPVYSEQELVDLAQKGTHYTQKRQKDSEWERDLQAREERLERLAPHIERIVEFLDSGGELPQARIPKKEEPEEPEEEILDPVAARKFKMLEEKLISLEKENTYLKQQDQSQSFDRAQKELTATFNNVIKETPFTQIVDDEGKNVSQKIFAGLLAGIVNDDALRAKQEKGFKMRPIADYMAGAAKMLSFYEGKLKSNGPAEITGELIKTKFPKIAESLGQEALDAYLKSIEDKSTPVIRPTKTEPTVRQPKKEVKGISDAIDQALTDPEISEGLEELGRRFRHEQGG